MQTSGLCRQRHFPAVAQPFRVLWAPWAPALFFFIGGLILSIICMGIFGSTIGSFILVFNIVAGHITAILVGLKMRYMASLITGVENRRTGSTNLSEKEVPGSHNFSNI